MPPSASEQRLAYADRPSGCCARKARHNEKNALASERWSDEGARKNAPRKSAGQYHQNGMFPMRSIPFIGNLRNVFQHFFMPHCRTSTASGDRLRRFSIRSPPLPPTLPHDEVHQGGREADSMPADSRQRRDNDEAAVAA